MSTPNESNINYGTGNVFSYLLGLSGSTWERLKSIGGALFVVFANASSLAYGSKATSTGAAALGSTTAYTGGVILSNIDASITIWIGSSSGVTAAVGAGNYPLLPGKDLVLPTGDLAGIFAIATSGTPTIAWVGVTA